MTQHLDPVEAVNQSESNRRSRGSGVPDRKQSDRPSVATHLNDKPSRRGQVSLERKFHSQAITITPASSTVTTNWPLRSNLMVMLDGTHDVPHAGGGSVRNLTNPTDAELSPMQLVFHLTNGGEDAFNMLLAVILESRQFDATVDSYIASRDGPNNNPRYKYSVKFISSEEEMEAMHKTQQDAAKRAEKAVTHDQVSSDPTIGATNAAVENNPTAIADFFNE